MKHESYVSSGICKKPLAQGDLAGSTRVVLCNPMDLACQVEMTVYFQDREPHTCEPIEVGPQRNALLVMPDVAPAVFEDCGFWGARFVSTRPVIVDLVDGLSYHHADDTFQGGCTNFLGTHLHPQWYFADGLWLEWKRFHQGDTSKAPFPFNEIEYYHFLNPGPRDAKVDMTLQYRNLEHTTFHLAVPAHRVYVWCNYEKIPYNQPYGVKVVSTEPISTSSTRYIYGLNGFEEWGLHTHCGMPAEPGPM